MPHQSTLQLASLTNEELKALGTQEAMKELGRRPKQTKKYPKRPTAKKGEEVEGPPSFSRHDGQYIVGVDLFKYSGDPRANSRKR